MQKKFEDKYIDDKKYLTVRDYYHYTGKYWSAALRTCNLKYNIPKQFFCNGSSYDYQFIIKELAKEFKG